VLAVLALATVTSALAMLAGSYTLLGAWLFLIRPFAEHEWRVARSFEKV
jgi:hypothetical protein